MKQSTWLRTALCGGLGADAYIWHYALLVAHARKEEDTKQTMELFQLPLYCKFTAESNSERIFEIG